MSGLMVSLLLLCECGVKSCADTSFKESWLATWAFYLVSREDQ